MSKKIAALSSNTSKPSLTSSAAAETVASSVDLLTDILVRIPTKSLIKFKSVSKQWLSLISDSQFSNNHTTRQNPPPLPSAIYFNSKRDFNSKRASWSSFNDGITFVSVNRRLRRSLSNFSFLDRLGSETVLRHSSNGLTLCSTRYRGGHCYVVCNLTTQKFVVLPKGSMSYRSFLVFYPKKSPYYKVAVVIFDFDATQLAVYSSESGSWKTTTLGPRVGNPEFRHVALWNGAIILMRCEGLDLQNCAVHDHWYARFDIDAEKLTTALVTPPNTNLSKEIFYFGECGGRLLLIQISQKNAAEFTVLEMMVGETDFRWTVNYVVGLKPLILPKSKGCKFTVITILKVPENESDLAVVLYIRGKIVQYNIECKTLKVLCDFPEGKFSNIIYRHMRSFHFIESLMPV